MKELKLAAKKEENRMMNTDLHVIPKMKVEARKAMIMNQEHLGDPIMGHIRAEVQNIQSIDHPNTRLEPLSQIQDEAKENMLLRKIRT